MRILITGSREWQSSRFVRQAILDALAGAPGTDHVLVHGGALGADSMADAAARSIGMRVEVHPAEWSKHQEDCWEACRARGRCNRAGYVRNAKMVSLGADICLAFIHNESKGATMCAKIAESAGITVNRYIVNDKENK